MPKPSHHELIQHARELVRDRGQWLIVTRAWDGKEGYALPSRSNPGLYHLVTTDPPHCDCTFAKLHGLTTRRIGRGGTHEPCSHLLAVQYIQQQDTTNAFEEAI